MLELGYQIDMPNIYSLYLLYYINDDIKNKNLMSGIYGK